MRKSCSLALLSLLSRRNFSSSFISSSATTTDSTTAVIKRKDKGHVEQSPHFIDRLTLTVTGGRGGDGCVSFSSIYGNEFNGPDGGDGGNGGHVFLKATPLKKSLASIPSQISAGNGAPGENQNCTGANAAHTFIQVPLGTVVKERARSDDGDINSDDVIQHKTICDLDTDGAVYLAARGGEGGKGNKFFTTAQNHTPELAEYGGEGEKKRYVLEMSTIADFGLVGYPNAGKSSILRAISRARPKVAGYCFTTLRPHVGIVFYGDGVRVAVADTPGLLPLAHRNHGLGIQFLRHIQRCSSLIFVIDFTLDSPLVQLENLLEECRIYDPVLIKKPRILVAHKIDDEKAKQNFEEFGDGFVAVSAKFGTGLGELLNLVRREYLLVNNEDEKHGDCDEISDEVTYSPVKSNSNRKSWR